VGEVEDRIPETLRLAKKLDGELEKVLVVTVDSKTGEIIDALVQPLDGFIRALAEAAEGKAAAGEPLGSMSKPAPASWWRPKA
jgi:hypothetical protein